MKDRVLVQDENGYIYNPAANSLTRGYQPTFKTAINPTLIFIDRAKKVHGDRYDYSKTKYINHRTRLTITCGIHGDFQQQVKHHYAGSGCPMCGIDERPSLPPNPVGTSTLYVVKLETEEEAFYKIGITKKNLHIRFSRCPAKPYVVTDFCYITGQSETVYKTEQKIHKFIKSFRYCPQHKFKGYTECFNENGAKVALTLMNNVKELLEVSKEEKKHITSPVAR